ncbi:S8 family peptidase [Kosmotoga pacifica]|uniref:S8 family peptidase n=1 Tax=Kosmotoga pacifica TaxID=1330330 RepID=UPI001C54D83C|nr:S8 family peptidase [Kosmotoga pacifica]
MIPSEGRGLIRKLVPFLLLFVLLFHLAGCQKSYETNVRIHGRIRPFTGNIIDSPFVSRVFSGNTTFAGAEYIVKFQPNVANNAVSLNIPDHVQIVYELNIPHKGRYLLVRTDNPQELYSIPGVESVEENGKFKALKLPDDPLIAKQWYLTKIGVSNAWNKTTGSPLVVVAVVDSGVRLDHPDLQNIFLDSGYDFIDNDSDPTDPDKYSDYHGTHISGIISALTDNSEGIAGVCWGGEESIKLLPIRVLSASTGDALSVSSGIVYAVEHGAKVINLSLGSDTDFSIVRDAIEYAYENDVVVVAASGNDGKEGLLFPAAYSQTIAVGATAKSDLKAWYSNYGSEIDLVSPGGDYSDNDGDGLPDAILSTYDTNDYVYMAGTSMSAPQVSAAVALLLSKGFTGVEEVRQILKSTALDLGDPGDDLYFGAGLLQIDAAFDYAELNFEPAPFIIQAVDPYSNKPLANCVADFNGEFYLEVHQVPFYLQVWQDFDRDGEISPGDMFGYYGYEGGDVLAGIPATITSEGELNLEFFFAPILTYDHE